MGRIVRLSEGRFGRLVLEELAAEERIQAAEEAAIVLQSRYDELVFLNPGESHATRGPTKVLIVYAARNGCARTSRYSRKTKRTPSRRPSRPSPRASASSPTRLRSRW